MRVIAQNRYAWRASIVVMVILLLVGGQNALAICTFTPQFVDATFVLPSTITVSRTAAAGDVLYRSPSLRIPPVPGVCNKGESGYDLAGYLAPMQAVPNMPLVYQTNIPGIGVRVFESTYSNASEFQTFKANDWRSLTGFASNGFSETLEYNFKFDFIFTGIVSPGTLELPSLLAGLRFQTRVMFTLVGDPFLFIRLFTSGTTQIIAPGCVIHNNAIAVRLPTISSSNLNSVGATAGVTPFNISLLCRSSIKVAYQIDGTSATGMAHIGILANRTDAGGATGVGVQILAGQGGSTTPVTFNNTPFTTFVTTTSANQPVTIPFVARYYRTSATMTVGTVWTWAIFTMDYQ